MPFNPNELNTDDPKKAASQLGRLHAELEDASDVTRDLYFKVADLQQQLAAAGRLDLELQDMQLQYDKLKSEEEQLKSQLQTAYAENIRYAEQFNGLEEQLKTLHQQNTDLQKKFAHVEILDEEVKEAVQRNRRLQEQVKRLNELESELSILTEERDLLKDRKQQAELRVAELERFKQEETLKFQQQLAHFAQLSRNLQHQLLPLTEKIQQLQKELYTVESWKQRYEESQQENEELRKKFHLVDYEVKLLQQQLDEANRRQQQEQLRREAHQTALHEIKLLQQQLNQSIEKLAGDAAPDTGTAPQTGHIQDALQQLQQQVLLQLPYNSANIPMQDETAAPAEPDAVTEPPAEKDDLRKITGISFTAEKLLNEFGYFYYSQIARLNGQDMQLLKEQLKVNISNEIFERWKAEAAVLAAKPQTDSNT